MPHPRREASGALRKRILLLVGACVLGAPGPASAASAIEGITAVSSRVFGGYARVRLADGTLKPETYAFGNGGLVTAGAAGGETPARSATRPSTTWDLRPSPRRSRRRFQPRTTRSPRIRP